MACYGPCMYICRYILCMLIHLFVPCVCTPSPTCLQVDPDGQQPTGPLRQAHWGRAHLLWRDSLPRGLHLGLQGGGGPGVDTQVQGGARGWGRVGGRSGPTHARVGPGKGWGWGWGCNSCCSRPLRVLSPCFFMLSPVCSCTYTHYTFIHARTHTHSL